MLLLAAVVAQLFLLLYCYDRALRRNARRLQLLLGARLPNRTERNARVQVTCEGHVHGLMLCDRCRERVLRGTQNPAAIAAVAAPR